MSDNRASTVKQVKRDSNSYDGEKNFDEYTSSSGRRLVAQFTLVSPRAPNLFINCYVVVLRPVHVCSLAVRAYLVRLHLVPEHRQQTTHGHAACAKRLRQVCLE